VKNAYEIERIVKQLENATKEVVRLKKLNNQLVQKNRKLEATNNSRSNQIVGLRVMLGVILILSVVAGLL
jgi:hypothetical protein